MAEAALGQRVAECHALQDRIRQLERERDAAAPLQQQLLLKNQRIHDLRAQVADLEARAAQAALAQPPSSSPAPAKAPSQPVSPPVAAPSSALPRGAASSVVSAALDAARQQAIDDLTSRMQAAERAASESSARARAAEERIHKITSENSELEYGRGGLVLRPRYPLAHSNEPPPPNFPTPRRLIGKAANKVREQDAALASLAAATTAAERSAESERGRSAALSSELTALATTHDRMKRGYDDVSLCL